MAGRAPAFTDPIYLAVKAGTRTGAQGCMDLLDKALLNGQDRVADATAGSLGLAVLNHFQRFHRGWFPVGDFDGLMGRGDNDRVHLDSSAGANFITYNLFKGRPYSETVTGAQDMRALRSEGVAMVLGDSNYQGSHVNGVKVGTLIGVTPWATGTGWYMRNGTMLNSATDYNLYGQNVPPAGSQLPPRVSGNSGILGSNSYIYGNIPGSRRPDGALAMNRILAKNTLESLLCLKAPFIRDADAAGYVTPGAAAPFRTNAQCMACHYTQDSLSAAWRNYAVSGYLVIEGDKTAFASRYPANGGPNSQLNHHLVQASGNYGSTYPYFTLKFRSYLEGAPLKEFNVIDVINSDQALARMGQIFSEQDEFYACAAKRYFAHFTGIDANFADPGRTPLNAQEIYYKAKVLELGQRLKQHQSLRTLIQEIVESELFQKQGQRDLY
ncbi:MAG: hypothetical protein AB7P04_13145 [Bacteriovoracia bacterium]